MSSMPTTDTSLPPVSAVTTPTGCMNQSMLLDVHIAPDDMLFLSPEEEQQQKSATAVSDKTGKENNDDTATSEPKDTSLADTSAGGTLLDIHAKNDEELMLNEEEPKQQTPAVPMSTEEPSVDNNILVITHQQSIDLSMPISQHQLQKQTLEDTPMSQQQQSFVVQEPPHSELDYVFRNTRYFLIKSVNYENVELAKDKNVWSTMRVNEMRLNKAYRECANVILVFSVAESGRFQGVARLVSECKYDPSLQVNWLLPSFLSSKANRMGVFQIDWLSKHDLHFTKTLHLLNSWNENKLVKVGRDGQELEPSCGEALCRLFYELEIISNNPPGSEIKDEHLMSIIAKSKKRHQEIEEEMNKSDRRHSSRTRISRRYSSESLSRSRSLSAASSRSSASNTSSNKGGNARKRSSSRRPGKVESNSSSSHTHSNDDKKYDSFSNNRRRYNHDEHYHQRHPRHNNNYYNSRYPYYNNQQQMPPYFYQQQPNFAMGPYGSQMPANFQQGPFISGQQQPPMGMNPFPGAAPFAGGQLSMPYNNMPPQMANLQPGMSHHESSRSSGSRSSKHKRRSTSPRKKRRSSRSPTPKYLAVPKEVVLHGTYEEYLAAAAQQQGQPMTNGVAGSSSSTSAAYPSKYDQDVEEFLRRTTSGPTPNSSSGEQPTATVTPPAATTVATQPSSDKQRSSHKVKDHHHHKHSSRERSSHKPSPQDKKRRSKSRDKYHKRRSTSRSRR